MLGDEITIVDQPNPIDHLAPLKATPQWAVGARVWNPDRNNGEGGFSKPPACPKRLIDLKVNEPNPWSSYEETSRAKKEANREYPGRG